jgi:ribosomal-protein-alanine N-acetyltransferase
MITQPATMQLVLRNSTIRPYRAGDAASATRQIGTYSVARYTSVIPHPYALTDAEEWIAIATAQMPMVNFAITVDDCAVGGIGFKLTDPAKGSDSAHVAEIGYWLGEMFWGRGIMTEAVTAFADWGFEELGLVRIEAAVYAPNGASARVLEKAGFAFEGRHRARYCKDGEYFDGLMYAKIRGLP